MSFPDATEMLESWGTALWESFFPEGGVASSNLQTQPEGGQLSPLCWILLAFCIKAFSETDREKEGGKERR